MKQKFPSVIRIPCNDSAVKVVTSLLNAASAFVCVYDDTCLYVSGTVNNFGEINAHCNDSI